MADGSANPEGSGSDAQELAHDVLQSVAVIRSIVAVARLGVDEPGRVAECLAVVEREAQVMGDLCRFQLTGSPPHTEIDLAAVLRRSAARMGAAHGVRVVVELDDDLRLVGDELAWERGVVNLLENACRAAGPSGRVLVRGSATADHVQVEVSDSGPGFAESAPGRSSLGMVAVMRLVEAHGGHLELRRGELGGAQLTMVAARAPRAGGSSSR